MGSHTDRIEGVDLARFLALAGMMVVHLGPEGLVRPALGDLVAGGRAATLFAFLAGLSIALVHRYDPRGSGSSRAIAIRAVLIFLLGVALGSLDEIGVYVILAYYGVLFALAIPLRRLSAPSLLVLASVWALVAPVLSFDLRRVIGFRAGGQVEWADLSDPWSTFLELTVDGIYPVVVWVVYLMVGLAVGQLDPGRPRVAARLALAGVGLLVAAYVLAWLFVEAGVVDEWIQTPRWTTLFVHANQVPTDSWANLALLGRHTNTPLNVVSSVGSALLVTGVCVLLLQGAGRRTRWVTYPFRAAGSMTLTLYTAHALLVWVGNEHGFTFTDGTYAEWVAQLVLLTLFATAWRRRFRRGPLEAVVRLLSVPRSAGPARVEPDPASRRP